MTLVDHPVGSAVFVNGEEPGTVVEAEPRSGEYTLGRRPFVSYLVRFQDGREEGFTGEYLSGSKRAAAVRRATVARGWPA